MAAANSNEVEQMETKQDLNDESRMDFETAHFDPLCTQADHNYQTCLTSQPASQFQSICQQQQTAPHQHFATPLQPLFQQTPQWQQIPQTFHSTVYPAPQCQPSAPPAESQPASSTGKPVDPQTQYPNIDSQLMAIPYIPYGYNAGAQASHTGMHQPGFNQYANQQQWSNEQILQGMYPRGPNHFQQPMGPPPGPYGYPPGSPIQSCTAMPTNGQSHPVPPVYGNPYVGGQSSSTSNGNLPTDDWDSWLNEQEGKKTVEEPSRQPEQQIPHQPTTLLDMPPGMPLDVHPEGSVKGEMETDIKEQATDGEMNETKDTIEVAGIKHDLCDDDDILLHFESKRNDGGDINHHEFDHKKGKAIFQFCNPEVARKFVERGSITIKGTTLSIFWPGEQYKNVKSLLISGIKPETDKDTVLMFFENEKRSGGGEGAEIAQYDRKLGTVVITFQDATVAQRVLQKQPLIFQKTELHVVPYVPGETATEEPETDLQSSESSLVTDQSTTSTDPKLLFLGGLSETMNQQTLQLLIENVSGHDEESFQIIFGSDKTSAVVKFDDVYDYEDVSRKLSGKNAKGSTKNIQWEKVDYPTAVQMHGFKSTPNKELIELYCERHGGTVRNVAVNPNDGGSVVVYISFDDYKAVERFICSMPHRIDQCPVDVQPYYSCLGTAKSILQETSHVHSSVAASPPRPPKPAFIVPEAVEMKTHPLILSFLQSSAKHGCLFYESFVALHAPMSFQDDGSIRFECQLKADMKDALMLAKSWQSDVKAHFENFMKEYCQKPVQIESYLWTDVIHRMSQRKLDDNEEWMMQPNPETNIITVFGHKHQVSNTVRAIEHIHKEVQVQVERENKRVTGKVDVKPHQIKLLIHGNFVQRLQEEFQDVKVHMQKDKNFVLLEGKANNINNAKLKVYQWVHGFPNKDMKDLSAGLIAFLKLDACQKYFEDQFQKDGIIAFYCVDPQSVTMHAESEQHLSAAIGKVKNDVVENAIETQEASKHILHDKKWDDVVDDLKRKNGNLVHVHVGRNRVDVAALHSSVDSIKTVLREFIKTNTIVEHDESMQYAHAFLIGKYGRDELNALEKELVKNGISLDPPHVDHHRSYIRVKGPAYLMKDSLSEVRQLVRKIRTSEYIVDKRGGPKIFWGDRGNDQLRTICTLADCFVQIKGKHTSFKTPKYEAPSLEEIKKVGMHGSGKKFVVYKGDITRCKVDAIVNAANEDLEHCGGLALAIVKAGGRSIQSESSEIMRKCKQPLNVGDAVCTGPGNLSCKTVIHAVGPRYKDGKNGEEEELKKAVTNSLKEAEGNNRSSVAFPALSSGIFHYPKEGATFTIIEAASDYFDDSENSSIQEVHFVANDDETVDAFMDALEKIVPDAVEEAVEATEDTGLNSDDESTDDELEKMKLEAKGDFVALDDALMTKGNIKVKLVKGQLAEQEVDVIMNTAHTSLDLSKGAVSKAISGAAGGELQQELNQKYKKGVKHGEIVVTSAYNLSCKEVYHGACTKWDNGQGQTEEILRQLMSNSLSQTEKSHYNPKSIAFPAIGTGKLGIPADFVAQVMYEEVHKFSQNNRDVYLKEVHFVIYDQDTETFEAFKQEQSRLRNGGKAGLMESSGGHSRSQRGRDSSSEERQDTKSGAWSGTDQRQASINGLKVEVQQGDLTRQEVDAIVNSTNDKLDLTKGAVAKAIMQYGGKKVTEECKRSGGTKNGFAVTTGGKLKCRKIIHLDGRHFRSDWRRAVLECLQLADRCNLKSIALPALGTGAASKDSDSDRIADDIMKGIAEFMNRGRPRTLSLVRITLFKKDMVSVFKTALQTFTGARPKDSRGGHGRSNHSPSQHSPKHDHSSPAKHPRQSNQAPSTLTLEIFAFNEQAIKEAKKSIEKVVDDQTEKKTIDNDKKLKSQQVDKIKRLGSKYDINVKVNYSGQITLEGLKNDVGKATEKVYEIFHDALEEENKQEKKKRKEAEAAAVTKDVQWKYEDSNGQMVDYPSEVNAAIEREYTNRKPRHRFRNDNKKPCEIKFNHDNKDEDMYEEEWRGGKRRVIRKNLKDNGISLPTTWSPMQPGEIVKLVQLSNSSTEYQNVDQLFSKTATGKNIRKIERIQNPGLYRSYQAKKLDMEEKLPNRTIEHQLFHGTDSGSLDGINANGFNRSYCGKNGTALGAGVYFARDASYSVGYARNGSMYVARVLTGEHTPGSSSMKVPPLKPNSKVHYDSVSDGSSPPAVYVIFYDTQAYPEYLISF